MIEGEVMEKSLRDKYRSLLNEKGVTLPCPRCGHNVFTIADGYFNQVLQQNFTGIVLGGMTLPSVVTVCNRCGYISQHALGGLDENILNKDEKKP